LRSRTERGPDEARTAVPKRESFEREREESLMKRARPFRSAKPSSASEKKA
jgi:hypothetical protein